MKKFLLSLCAIAPLSVMASPALTQDQVGQMATSYFKSHPEQMVNILKSMQQHLRQAALNKAKQVIIDNKALILGKDSFLPITGNPKGSKTLLFVFDFQCVYCHKEAPLIAKLVKDNTDLKVVMMPLHVFGPASLYANQVALYANSIGKFKSFYEAMEQAGLIEGKLTKEAVNKIMAKAGIKQTDFEQALKKGRISSQIKQIDLLAQKLRIQGTPFMVIMPSNKKDMSFNDITLLPGYLAYDPLNSVVENNGN